MYFLFAGLSVTMIGWASQIKKQWRNTGKVVLLGVVVSLHHVVSQKATYVLKLRSYCVCLYTIWITFFSYMIPWDILYLVWYTHSVHCKACVSSRLAPDKQVSPIWPNYLPEQGLSVLFSHQSGEDWKKLSAKVKFCVPVQHMCSVNCSVSVIKIEQSNIPTRSSPAIAMCMG